MTARRSSLAAAVAALALGAGGLPRPPEESRDVRFTASDGVSLQATVTGEAPLAPRPDDRRVQPLRARQRHRSTPGRAYNYLLVQIRGTGDSDGRFDALGPRTQADVAEVLRWACDQPWSDGRLGAQRLLGERDHDLQLAAPAAAVRARRRC